jgi:UDP-N-acetylglucosamine 1-carboxyvinyltransferase
MRITGGNRLFGRVKISGAKNLALPALIAGLLSDEDIVLHNVPKLADVRSMLDLLEHFGADISFPSDTTTISISSKNMHSFEAPYDFVRKMRASILALGPLVGRYGRAYVSLPGGCAIGTRGVDLHLKAMEALGASISIENGYIKADVPKELVGCDINFPITTVTGTENILMAACFAKGTTRIINAAMEPEVVAFVELLNKMGADIEGHGTPVITTNGIDSLHGCEFEIIPDRIEAGTYAIAAAVTRGNVFLEGCSYNHMCSFFDSLKLAGVEYREENEGVWITSGEDRKIIQGIDIQTAPYPGFPTDLQAQFMVIMSICDGVSSITENIFENRFMHIPELLRMGADISIHGKTAVVTGVNSLRGAQVMATDLRASVSLILAGLIAEGETIVNRLYHLDRGYENIDQKLTTCGAQVERFAV